MFSTNKNRKIGMLIFLFVVSFILGMLINIQRLGSLPMKLIQVEWNDTVGCVYENLDYENSSDHKYDLYVPKNLDTPESKCLILFWSFTKKIFSAVKAKTHGYLSIWLLWKSTSTTLK